MNAPFFIAVNKAGNTSMLDVREVSAVTAIKQDTEVVFDMKNRKEYVFPEASINDVFFMECKDRNKPCSLAKTVEIIFKSILNRTRS